MTTLKRPDGLAVAPFHLLALQTGTSDTLGTGYWFEMEEFDIFIEKLRPMLAGSPPASEQQQVVGLNLAGLAEQRAEKSGWWGSCSGCYETEGGRPVGTYPYSNALACSLGRGCSECGGLGAVWHRAEDWLPTVAEEEELDRGCPPPEERMVTIPACDQHEGLNTLTVTMPWACLHCGGPRGEPFDSLSFDGSRRLSVHSWVNPCGHLETYAEIRAFLSALQAQES